MKYYTLIFNKAGLKLITFYFQISYSMNPCNEDYHKSRNNEKKKLVRDIEYNSAVFGFYVINESDYVGPKPEVFVDNYNTFLELANNTPPGNDDRDIKNAIMSTIYQYREKSRLRCIEVFVAYVLEVSKKIHNFLNMSNEDKMTHHTISSAIDRNYNMGNILNTLLNIASDLRFYIDEKEEKNTIPSYKFYKVCLEIQKEFKFIMHSKTFKANRKIYHIYKPRLFYMKNDIKVTYMDAIKEYNEVNNLQCEIRYIQITEGNELLNIESQTLSLDLFIKTTIISFNKLLVECKEINNYLLNSEPSIQDDNIFDGFEKVFTMYSKSSNYEYVNLFRTRMSLFFEYQTVKNFLGSLLRIKEIVNELFWEIDPLITIKNIDQLHSCLRALIELEIKIPNHSLFCEEKKILINEKLQKELKTLINTILIRIISNAENFSIYRKPETSILLHEITSKDKLLQLRNSIMSDAIICDEYLQIYDHCSLACEIRQIITDLVKKFNEQKYFYSKQEEPKQVGCCIS